MTVQIYRLLCLAWLSLSTVAVCAEQILPKYVHTVLADQPVAYWRFSETDIFANLVAANSPLCGQTAGKVAQGQAGPRPEAFPDFDAGNAALVFDGKGSFVRVKDSGARSSLDFDNGDSITLEAWVNLRQLQNGQNMYIVGKGRTNNPGCAPHNQNYALRLRGVENSARASFVFRSRAIPGEPKGGPPDDRHWHRWTADAGFPERSGWHHVAITYTFGRVESIRGFVDGVEVQGRWDMGGSSASPPVVDDDELWIGSSMGGSASSSFLGAIDEVAIYRAALEKEQLQRHFRLAPGGQRLADNDGVNDNDSLLAAAAIPEVSETGSISVPAADIPSDSVRVEIIEGVAKVDSEAAASAKVAESYAEPAFGFVCAPKKYNAKGLISDRPSPFLLRASSRIQLPAGEHRLLLRARNATKLLMDGTLIASTPQFKTNTSGHGSVPESPVPVAPGTRELRPGQYERVATINSDGKPHVFMLEATIIGGKMRPEVGELSVSIAAGNEAFRLLSPTSAVDLTDESWQSYAAAQRAIQEAADERRRRAASLQEDAYWAKRHDLARKHVGQAGNSATGIDRFLAQAGKPAPLCDDWTFARRASLDVTGVIPSPELIEQFISDKAADRRAKLIDRLLADPGWADHWTGYWQDVLAENPGLLKPQLNNTGPFRWWIRESFADNKPMDRFATELVMMEGSQYFGGPAGFAMATQNDVPMAEKAIVISKAFLAAEMKCARCHDAPHHEFMQKETFSLAAMLKRAPQDVPKTSSVPRTEAELKEMAIKVSLKPGISVPPAWPFGKLIPACGSAADLPPGLLRKADDTREQFAALLTSPLNERFAEVIVNRIWKRYLGKGLVEPVDDWETAKPCNPELLNWLARELMTHDYDLKHVARLILNSQTYQRAVGQIGNLPASAERQIDNLPYVRRRMSAEQIADSLFAAAGKKYGCEELTFDVDGVQSVDTFQNFGAPRRAWEFSSLSNERDRPALSLPVAQSITDLLTRFGWRESRQAPLTVREEAPNVLQPAMLANGVVGNRIARLSDDSAITALCLENQPVEELVRKVCMRVLSRPPSATESSAFAALLAEGYTTRIVQAAAPAKNETAASASRVSWSNHLSPEATKIKMEQERAARQGDPPTARLAPAWRERMEDVVWTLINSPEFVFVP